MEADQAMSEITALGLDGIRYLDEISDRNLVYCYRHELTRGAFQDLSPSVRKRMIVNGILIRQGRSSIGASNFTLTTKGMRILRDLEKNI